MATYKIMPATIEHAESLKNRLRQNDVEEIYAASGLDASKALLQSWRLSEVSYVGLMDNLPIAIFGAARRTLISEDGIPWMLGSEELNSKRVIIEVGRRSIYYVNEMKRRFKRLENWIDARQTKSIKWLKWCGFTIDEAKPYGFLGMPFHYFWSEK